MKRLLLCLLCLALPLAFIGCGSNKGVEMPTGTFTDPGGKPDPATPKVLPDIKPPK